MEREAPPCQLVERGAAAPVEREEAARFAGGGARHLVTFDDDRLRAAPACEIRHCRADCPTAADHDALARAHAASHSQPASRLAPFHLIADEPLAPGFAR